MSPSTRILPKLLCLSYVEDRLFPLLSNRYPDGTVQRSLVVDGVNPARPARTWKQSVRLTTSALTSLLAFYEGCSGGYLPFYFYDLFAASPIGSNWDVTGANATGKIKVKFQSSWGQTTELGRHIVQDLSLVELL